MVRVIKKFEFRKAIEWFCLCLFLFVFSTFLHECGHGLAYAISGVPVSTGFNKVGRAYTYPSDPDFRMDADYVICNR